MKLDPERWNRIDAILDELLELPESQRLETLRARCADDTTLMEDIAKLLADCEADASLLDGNALQMARTLVEQLAPDPTPAPLPHSLKGVRIGAYTLEAEIGRGGMGVVYSANRTQGDYTQTVAIKILMHVNVTVAERFRREQQALAVLKHPNITQLLDAGVTEQGMPYLIMEMIEGESITDYCARHSLSLNARLALLDQVLDALAFSHKNLIVHRDIKPSNILVTREGQAKLLDFSIAKLLDASWALEETATHLHLMTPSYSAPEQVLNQPITVATDIYQLGLLFYRVLTGHRPLAKDVGSLHELVKIVCQSEVTRPSHAFSRSEGREESLPNIQDARKHLAGDLDAIVLKMLRKEPGARYASIEAVRADLHAYHHHLPVSAHRAALGYQTGKYLRRNWRTITLVSVTCFALLGYAASMQLQNTRVKEALAKAELEQRKAEEVSQFLAQTFEAADPNKGGLKGITAADLLEEARTKINEELKDSPEIQAPLLNIFSKIYFRQQEYQKAEMLLANLVNNEKTAQQLDKKLLAEIQLRLAQQKIGLGQISEAEALLRQSLELQATLEKNDSLYGETLTLLGHCLYTQKRRQEADEVTHRAIGYLKELGESGDRIRAIALNSLANSQFMYDDLDGAIQNIREALALRQRVLGKNHTETSNLQLLLARMLLEREDFDESEELAQSAFASIKAQLSSSHPNFTAAIGTLAKLAQKKGQLDLASKLLLDSIGDQELEKFNTSQVNSYLLMLDVLLDQNKPDDVLQKISKLSDMPYAQSNNMKSRLALYSGRAFLISNKPDQALEKFDHAMKFLNAGQNEIALIERERAIALLALGKNIEAYQGLISIKSKMEGSQAQQRSQYLIVCRLIINISKNTPELETTHPCAQSSQSLNGIYIPFHLKKWL